MGQCDREHFQNQNCANESFWSSQGVEIEATQVFDGRVLCVRKDALRALFVRLLVKGGIVKLIADEAMDCLFCGSGPRSGRRE